MNVGHFMTKNVVTVTEDTRVTDAVDLMERNQFHRLPVIKDNQYIGIVTDKEISENSPSHLTSLSIFEMNYLFDKMTVGEIMTRQEVTVHPDTLLEEAATIMISENLTVLPVLDDQKAIVGIVTYKDIFKALIESTGYHDPGSRFLILIEDDRVGIISEITKTLADEGINLSHIFVHRLADQIEITVHTADVSGKKATKALKDAGYTVELLENGKNK